MVAAPATLMCLGNSFLLRRLKNQIKNSSLANRAKELDVFGVCPEQWYSRTSRTPTLEMLLRAVIFVPDLLGKEMSRCGEAFQPANVLPRIPPRGQFVMTPFSRKQGPAAAFTGTDERSA